MKKTPLFAIILVALSLGCSISDSPVGPGLMIKEFKFTPNDLYGNQKTALTLVIQNKGSKNINGAYAEIYGFGKESDMWLLEGGETETTTVKFNLRAPSSYTNNVGEEKRFVWLLSNNDLIPKDAVRPYTAKARVCYPYETSVLARAEIISENEWMSNPPTQHQIEVTQTTGPVRITIISKQPVIMSSKVALELLVENVGSGTVAKEGYCGELYGGSSIDPEKLNRIDMEITGISDDCVIEGDENLFLEQGRYQRITVSCAVSGIDAPITTADIQIGLKYDYYLDARATVRVDGPVVPSGSGDVDGPDVDKLALPVPAVDGTMVIETLDEYTGTCDVETDISVKVADIVDGLITTYKFKGVLNKDEIKLTCTAPPCTGDVVTKPLGTIVLVRNDEREARISLTYDSDEDECTFSSSIA
ncbi:MAG: hypothetical protein KAJ24_03495 [Candidatus Aenigmarchaeota archaeon]|nr:hypothetical protein [Candidatus Aenigmarchaeota archaeon]